jgi:signal peptidase II
VTQQLIIAGLVLAADRYTKAAVRERMGSGRVFSVGPCLRVRYVLTCFRTHGLLRAPISLLIIWTAAAAVLGIAAHSGMFFRSSVAGMGLAAALAGSGSNLYDRLRHGATVDFLDFGWWPTSNFADIALVAGVGVALCFV